MESKWIRIQDKLPEPYKNVLLTGEDGLGFFIGCWSKHKQEWIIYTEDVFTPYYWLPIPEIPEEEDEDTNMDNDIMIEEKVNEKQDKWEERRYELIKELVLNEAQTLMKGSYFEYDYLKRNMDIELRHATQITDIIINYLKKEEKEKDNE